MTRRLLAAAAAVVLCLSPAAAKPPEPTVEVRLRAVNDVADLAEYFGGLVGQEEQAKQVKGLVQAFTTEKGIEGLDPKRPFGAYAVLTPGVADSPAYLLVPVADEESVLNLLRNRVNVTPEKLAGGAYKVHVPLLPVPLHFRFAHGYAYLTLRAEDLAADNLIPASAFFANDDGALLSVVAHLDRIPDAVKSVAVGQFENGIAIERQKKGPNETPAQRKLKNLLFDAIVGAGQSGLTEGNDFTLRVKVDPKADDLSLELGLTGKPGTPLAKTLAAMGGRPTRAAGIAGEVAAPVFSGGVKVSVPDGYRPRFEAVVDELMAEAVTQAKENDKAAVKRVLGVLAPTFKAGELDAAAAFGGPDAGGKYAFVAAVAVKDGKAIEQLVKDFAPFVPADKAAFTFDVDTVNGFTLHKVAANKVEPGVERVFGTKTLWVATGPDCVAVSFEPDGAGLRRAVAAKPVAAPVAGGQMSVARTIPLTQPGLQPDEVAALVKDAFGDASPAGKDTFRLSVEGGDALTARVVLKGKGVRMAAAADKLKVK